MKIIDGAPTLLSIDEANQYFTSDDDRICYPTQQAKNNGAWSSGDNGASAPWLRSPGGDSDNAAWVDADGSVDSNGGGVSNPVVAIRPALWVNL